MPCSTLNAASDGKNCWCQASTVYVDNKACCSPGGRYDAVQNKCVCPTGTNWDETTKTCTGGGGRLAVGDVGYDTPGDPMQDMQVTYKGSQHIYSNSANGHLQT